jgi:hypothetical protein
MFIYADESGHSGKYIFNDPPNYYQGAILSVVELEPLLQPIVAHYCSQIGAKRLHANELPYQLTVEIVERCMDAMENNHWNFHLTTVEKGYLSPTKFVDTIFDPHENLRVPPLWYWHEFFRHALCCLFDDILILNNDRENFWYSYRDIVKCCGSPVPGWRPSVG